MTEKTSENYAELTEYFSQTVHQFVDRLSEQAGGMDKIVGSGSRVELNEMAMEKIDREVNKMQEFVAKNPARAAMMAFGVGAIASRVLGGSGAKAKPVEVPADKPKLASAKKAPAKKAAAKKAPAKKAAAKKAPVKKAPVKKAA